MAYVLNQYKIYKKNDIYHPITIGYCSTCGEEVYHSQYGEDEDCPKCNSILLWNYKED